MHSYVYRSRKSSLSWLKKESSRNSVQVEITVGSYPVLVEVDVEVEVEVEVDVEVEVEVEVDVDVEVEVDVDVEVDVRTPIRNPPLRAVPDEGEYPPPPLAPPALLYSVPASVSAFVSP